MRRSSTQLFSLFGVAIAMIALACGSATTELSTTSPTATVPTETAPAATAVELTSFRYELTITLEGSSPFSFEQRGAVMLPDREQATQVYEAAWLRHETDRVAIGDQVWLRGDLPWVDLGASPLGVIGGGSTASRLQAMTGQATELDGHASTRYDLTAAEFVELAGPPTGDVADSTIASIWVSDDLGVPLRLEISATDEAGDLSLVLTVSDVNSDEINVEAPPVAQASNGAGR